MSTPVMILNELMVRRGNTPQFELLNTEGINTHLTTFHFRVIAGNIIAHGKARSKKEAKHEAARAALEKLAEQGIFHPVHKTPAPPSPVQIQNTSSSPELQVNAIMPLTELCSENNIPQPDFELISDIGPAHCRQFTMMCKVASLEATATDSTKKKAKQAAALKMLHRLTDTLPDFLHELQSSTAAVMASEEVILNKYDELSIISKRKINWGRKVSSYPQALREAMKEKNLTYKELWQGVNRTEWDGLNQVLNKLEIVSTLKTYESNDVTMASVTLDSDPEFTLCGIHENDKVAVSEALQETMAFLDVMTSD